LEALHNSNHATLSEISILIYGFGRVSTDGQTLDAQRAELKRAKAVKVFAKTESGAQRDRPQLNRVF
jgi:DNA invertase Pin-like site-specific DNA recombinase